MSSEVPSLRVVAVLNHRVVADQTFDQDRVVIGRAPECDLQLDNLALSRQHAELLRSPFGWLLRDPGSRNGIRVNGAVVEQQQLRDGDRIQLGKFSLICELSQDASGSRLTHKGDAESLQQGRTVPLEEEEETPAPPEAHLLLTDASRRRHSLLRDAVHVGRHPSCTLRLSGLRQPKRLASIVRGVTGYTLLNLSPNAAGVYHNGKPVAFRVELHDGARLELGPIRARFLSGRRP
jgi:pSer/pThr/pTyr-binding forkhead associated (FHA) protein